METRKRIAVIPGDGIGPEVTAEAVRVLETVSATHGVALELRHFDWGADKFLREGVTLLHVIDQHFVDDCVAAGMGAAEEITAQLRARAEANFEEMLTGLDADGVDIERMVVIGEPFAEILKIARDLDLPMIVMGARGRSTPPEELLFGSTVERVIRATRIPVLCVPY